MLPRGQEADGAHAMEEAGLVDKNLVNAWTRWALVWLTFFQLVWVLTSSIQFHNSEFLGVTSWLMFVRLGSVHTTGVIFGSIHHGLLSCILLRLCGTPLYKVVGSMAPLDGETAKEKPIFHGKCVACRGPAGKADGPIGTKLQPSATNFMSAESKATSQDELWSIIENGLPQTAMKLYKKQLTEAESQDALAYALTVRK